MAGIPDVRSERIWAKFTADMVRYAGSDVKPWSFAFLRRLVSQAYMHPGLLAIVVYRYGQWVQFHARLPIFRQVNEFIYYNAFNWVRTRLQIEIPRHVTIGAGLRIDHFGAIIINSQVVVGENLTITHGVLIGQSDTGIPRLMDGVALSVGVKVIGGVTLGNNVLAGAGAVVTKSFPDNAIIAGVPAKLLRIREPVRSPENVETTEPLPTPAEV